MQDSSPPSREGQFSPSDNISADGEKVLGYCPRIRKSTFEQGVRLECTFEDGDSEDGIASPRSRINSSSCATTPRFDSSDRLAIRAIDSLIPARATIAPRATMAPAPESLRSIVTFKNAGFPGAFLCHLANLLVERVYVPHDVILGVDKDYFQLNSSSGLDRSMYVIQHGMCRVEKHEEVVALLQRGDYVNEMALMGIVGKRLSNVVVAGEPCQVQVLTESAMVSALEQYPKEKRKAISLCFRQVCLEDKKGSDVVSDKDLTRINEKDCRQKALTKVFHSLSIFNQCEFEVIQELSATVTDVMFLPKENIVEEGHPGDSMFVLVTGKAIIHHSGKTLATWHAGSVAGELSLLGVVRRRLATIQADCICCLWEVSRDSFDALVERYPHMKEGFAAIIKLNLESKIRERVDTLPLFKSLDIPLRKNLALYSGRRAVWANDLIFKEGSPCDCMCIVSMGQVAVSRRGVVVGKYVEGSFFNVGNMLCFREKSYCTITAFTTCHVLFICRRTFAGAMERIPVVKAEMIKSEKIADEAWRTAVDKAVNNKGKSVMESLQLTMASKSHQLASAFTAWSRYVILARSFRRSGRQISSRQSPSRSPQVPAPAKMLPDLQTAKAGPPGFPSSPSRSGRSGGWNDLPSIGEDLMGSARDTFHYTPRSTWNHGSRWRCSP